MKCIKLTALLFILLVYAGCRNGDKDVETDDSLKPVPTGIPAPKAMSYTVINQFPHDTSSFTEGLEMHDGKLYESGGDYEHSVLQFGNARTGTVTERNKMGSEKIFGEGVTILNGKIYQLTYQSNIGYVYDLKDIRKPIKTFPWPYEGWGMTNNGTDLVIDIGGANLYFVDTASFKVKNTVSVSDHKGPVMQINELEYVDGFIWANIWNSNRVIKIDPESGHVKGEFYFQNIAGEDGRLLTGGFENTDVMNGIAYDPASKTFLLTGKRWPKIYEVLVSE